MRLAACALMVWMAVLFFGASSIVLVEVAADGAVSHRTVGCGALVQYLDTRLPAPGPHDVVDPVAAHCADLRAARAGLIGVLSAPTILLLWISARRLGLPSRRQVLSAAHDANAALGAGTPAGGQSADPRLS
jgi:hypothetical protein